MLCLVEQAFVGRDEKRATLKTPAWEVSLHAVISFKMARTLIFVGTPSIFESLIHKELIFFSKPLQHMYYTQTKVYYDILVLQPRDMAAMLVRPCQGKFQQAT